MKLSMVLITMTVLVAAIAASCDDRSEAAGYLVKPYPPADKGMTRFAIMLPKLENEGNYKVELFVGKTLKVDAVNHHFYTGYIETVHIGGWGFDCYMVKDLGDMMSTLVAGPNKLQEKFVTVESILVRYNSGLPIAVYVPEGAEVRYRIWSTTPEMIEMPKG